MIINRWIFREYCQSSHVSCLKSSRKCHSCTHPSRDSRHQTCMYARILSIITEEGLSFPVYTACDSLMSVHHHSIRLLWITLISAFVASCRPSYQLLDDQTTTEIASLFSLSRAHLIIKTSQRSIVPAIPFDESLGYASFPFRPSLVNGKEVPSDEQ